MVPRYEQADMSALWTEEAKYQFFLDVELALVKVLESNKIVPVGVHDRIKMQAQIKPDRVREIENTVHHDIIAFCTSITEQVPAADAKWFHFGCTSSDIIDTALALQMKKSIELIFPAFEKVVQQLGDKANQYRDLLCIGRSHGMYAEPMSFGQKFLLAHVEFKRRLTELKDFYQKEITGQMSGAVGNFTVLSPRIEEAVMKELGISAESVSTQVVPRDRIAKLVSIVALFAGALERFAIEIRHLHRSDVAEVSEGFMPGQKGSSTMPHKKNPIAAENLSGIARILRSHLLIAHENILLWHERDISHSSAERLYLPDMFGLILYSLRRLSRTLDLLQVDEVQIRKKAESAFAALSSFYMHKLLPHWEGYREELYSIIQAASFAATDAASFHQKVVEATTAKGVPADILPASLKLEDVYLKWAPQVFERAQK